VNWFVGLSVDDPVWVPTVFSKNRDRLLDGDIAAAFLSAVLNLPRVKGLLSDEHFSTPNRIALGQFREDCGLVYHNYTSDNPQRQSDTGGRYYKCVFMPFGSFGRMRSLRFTPRVL
jgi:hypothetical protein